MKRLLLLLPLIAFLPLTSAVSAAPYILQINLYGANVVPAVETHSYGFVRFFFNADRSEADYTVDIKGYSNSAVTGASIHAGAPGENGPLVYTLSDGNFIVTSGHITFTPEQLKTFSSGAWYITLDTVFHPDGEIRGQIYAPSDFLSPTATGAGYAPPSVPEPTQVPAPPPTPAPTSVSSGGGGAGGSNGGGTGTFQPPDTGDGGLK
jgi:CHRD domain